MTIQETGGTRKTIEARRRRASRRCCRAPTRCGARRSRPRELMLALQCGGSDGYSGITANPALGAAVDLLVAPRRHRRAVARRPRSTAPSTCSPAARATREVGEKLVDIIHWWEDYCAKQRRRDEQQSLARQQGGRPHHHPGEIAGRRRQGRHHHADRASTTTPSRSPPRASSSWTRRATTRSAATGPGGGRLQRDLLHHRPRLGLRLQADALDQARHQQRHLQAHDRRHGHQLRRHPRRRLDRGEGPGDLRRRSCASPPARRPRAKLLGYGDNEFVPWQIGATM